jgi:hypothetical protein
MRRVTGRTSTCRHGFYYTVINISSNIRLEYHQQVMSPSHSSTSQMQVPQSEAPRIPSMQVRMSKLSQQLFHASVTKNCTGFFGVQWLRIMPELERMDTKAFISLSKNKQLRRYAGFLCLMPRKSPPQGMTEIIERRNLATSRSVLTT